MNDGGPAYPSRTSTVLNREDGTKQTTMVEDGYRGMSLRDWFAGMLQADDRLVKTVRGMDDKDLAIFARCPDAEADFIALGEVDKYLLRFELEAGAVARVRFIQADAMLAAREKGGAE